MKIIKNDLKNIIKYNMFYNNPVYRQVLGICSALAVTNFLINTIFMCLGVIFTTALSNMTISFMRDYIPQRIRMIIQIVVIASYVIIVEILIMVISPDVHRFIGPYVGLIITNCIIMGRAEAFASKNKPLFSFVDGLTSGLGYTFVLVSIAFIREITAFGTLFGLSVPFKEIWWHQWTIMIMPPGAFFILAIFTWIARFKLLDKEL